MRFKAIKVRLVLSSVLAVLALSAVAVSAAQAATAEGPFYKITGARLASGKSQEVKAKMYSGNPFSFEIPNSGVKVGCTSAKFASGAKLLGSTGANAAGGEATIELSGCNTGGSSCELTSSTIKTEPLTIKMAYLNEARTGDMLMTFEPPKGIIGEVTFREGNCVVPGEWALGGHLVGKVEVAGKLVEVGKEPAAAKVLRITFPGLTEINTAWFEKNGALEKKKVELVVNGSAPPYNGALELEAGSAEWGIFT
jgi:hypothetical protein